MSWLSCRMEREGGVVDRFPSIDVVMTKTVPGLRFELWEDQTGSVIALAYESRPDFILVLYDTNTGRNWHGGKRIGYKELPAVMARAHELLRPIQDTHPNVNFVLSTEAPGWR